MRRLFALQNAQQNREVLTEIIANNAYHSTLTAQFSFERPFGKGDFVSLLFYLGFLTIKSKDGVRYHLVVPNYVILKLYLAVCEAVALTKKMTVAKPKRLLKKKAAVKKKRTITSKVKSKTIKKSK